jgi:secreted trypsin-like serine protease
MCFAFVGCEGSNPGAALNSSAAGIVGGRQASASENFWRFTVQLDSPTGDCTAVLVKKNVILSARHCVDESRLYVNFVTPKRKVTRDYVESSNCSISAEEFYRRHKSFSEPRTRTPEDFEALGAPDICALKLRDNAPKEFVPVAIATSMPAPGAEFIHLGWGATNENRTGDNTVLKVGTSKYVRSTPSILFSLEEVGGSRLCFGDSGGPVLWKDETGEYKLLGLNSVAEAPPGAPTKCTNADRVFSQYVPSYSSLWKDL